MKQLTIIGLIAAVIGFSGCTETNEHCKAGDSVEVETLIDLASMQSSIVEGGVRTYTWEGTTALLSTNGKVNTNLTVHIDGNDLSIPVTVTWQRVVNGTLGPATEIDPGQPSLSGVYTHQVLDQTDFSLTHTECEITYGVIATISFQTTGQESFDDQYLTDILVGQSLLIIGYFLEED